MKPTQKGLLLLGGVGAGALLTYYLDPVSGRRRRALVRDRAVHLERKGRSAVERTRRDLANRARGLGSELRARIRGERVDDAVLEERVRTALGRHRGMNGDLRILSSDGVIRLEGNVPADLADDLVREVGAVRGVVSVDPRFEIVESESLTEEEEEIEENGEAWSRTARTLAAVGGGALLAAGIRQRGLAGAALGVAGAGLLGRAVANRRLRTVAKSAVAPRPVSLHKSLHVDAPPATVYGLLSRLENLPRFMASVRDVETLENGNARWTVAGPAGIPVSFETEMLATEKNRRLAWETVPGSTIGHEGEILLEDDDGGTRLDVEMTYRPPAGKLGHAVARMFSRDPKSAMDADLIRLKTLAETGSVRAGRVSVRAEELLPV